MLRSVSALQIVAHAVLAVLYYQIANEYRQEGQIRRMWIYRGVAVSMLTLTSVLAYRFATK